MEIYVWGTGDVAAELSRWLEKYAKQVHIIAYTNSFVTKESSFLGEKLIAKENLLIGSDYIVLAISSAQIAREINSYLIEKTNIKQEKIIGYIDFMNLIRKERILKKYEQSNDQDICSVL